MTNFKISSGISKPRHVFVYIITGENVDAQTANAFHTTLKRCKRPHGSWDNNSIGMEIRKKKKGKGSLLGRNSPFDNITI